MKIDKKSARLLSLDVFRGMTIALMIIVNSPGYSPAYSWLDHAPWHGCTFADLVFPFFVLIMGISLVLTLSKSLARGECVRVLMLNVIKRSALLFLTGLLLNAFPSHFFDLDTLRVFGVLQRIALCYFFAAFLFLTTGLWAQAAIATFLLVFYWLIMTHLSVPGYGVNNLSVEGNLATYIDQLLIAPNHLYQSTFDPEGLLSTLPAIATALLGNLLGMWLIASCKPQETLKRLGLTGIALALGGWLWGLSFPINKALWTSSYVLWTGGLAFLGFAFCFWTIEIKGWKKWCKPFEIFGLNAMSAFILHVLFLKIQAMIHIYHADGQWVNLRVFITESLFGWASPINASLLYAFSYVLFWLVVIWGIHDWRQGKKVKKSACSLDKPVFE